MSTSCNLMSQTSKEIKVDILLIVSSFLLSSGQVMMIFINYKTSVDEIMIDEKNKKRIKERNDAP